MLKRFIVRGHSMEPVLHDGQKLLVYKTPKARVGDVVVAKHPHKPINVVKRVVKSTPEGFYIASINHGTGFGPVDILGRVFFSYKPLQRVKNSFK